MRKRRIKKFIGVFILLLILGGGIYLGLSKFYFKKEKEKTIEEEKLAIVKEGSFSDYTYIDSFRNYYIVNKNGLIGIIDNKGNVKVDFIYSGASAVIPSKETLVIESSDKYYLYNQDLKLIDTFNEEINVITDPINNKDYYFTFDALYDLEQNIIIDNINDYFDSSGWVEKIGNYVFIDSTIINLETKEEYPLFYYNKEDNYIYGIDEDENKIYYLDYNDNNLIIYNIDKRVTNGFILKDDANNIYFFTLNNGIIKKGSITNVGDYKFSYDTCSYGFKVYYQEKLVSDECYDDYYKNEGAKAISLIKDEAYYILNKDKIIKDEDEVLGVGDYLTYYNYENDSLTIKDLDGNVIDSKCTSSLEYHDAKSYVCDDFINEFLVDEKLNPISEYYDNLDCISNTPYCIFQKDDKYGLLENNKVLIEASYQSMEYEENIIASSLWGFDVYGLEKTSQEKLEVIIPSPYNSIDTIDIMNKYNLNYMEDLIKNNEELFKKYAYIVDNNVGLGIYKDKVMNLFYEVVQNKDLMNENVFLSALKKLKIEKKEVLSQEANGEYFDIDKRIDLKEDSDLVIYHELNHFLDYSLSKMSNVVYKYNDKYISYDEFQKLTKEERNNCELVYINDINFLIEGGAEYYASYYFNKLVVRTYPLQTSIIGALSYIYGFDDIKNIYLDAQGGNAKIYDMFAKALVSEEDFNKFLEYSSRFHEYNEKDQFFITDTLIKLYESVKKKSWTEDLEFKTIIAIILGYANIDKSYTNNYDEYQMLDRDFRKIYKNIVPDIAAHINVYPCSYFKTPDASYLIFSYYDNNDIAYEVVKYDFEKEKVLDRKTVKFD